MSKENINNSMLPIALKQVGLDLVSVQPLSSPMSYVYNSTKNEAIRRNNKLAKITGGEILDEEKSPGLFYLDFKYK